MSGWHIECNLPPVPADHDGRRRHDWQGIRDDDGLMVTGESRQEVERQIVEAERDGD